MAHRFRPAPDPPEGGAPGEDEEPPALDVARSIALRHLEAKPRSRSELAEKLAAREVPTDVTAELLDRFEEVGLLDDAAYAEMLVRSKHAERGLARRALAHELRRKGIEGEVAEAALDQVDSDDEYAAARRLVARRLAASRGHDRQRRRRRLGGMLARRGYSPDTAMRVVDEALDAEAAESSADDEPGTQAEASGWQDHA